MHISRAVRMSFSSRHRFGCMDCLGIQKLHVWCPALVLILMAILAVARFEAIRITTDILASPCTLVDSQIADVGTCTLCDDMVPASCEMYPISMARISVEFRHAGLDQNVTGTVWYCKDMMFQEPCSSSSDALDQYSIDVVLPRAWTPGEAPVACTTAEILREMEKWMKTPSSTCYYANADPKGENVWLTVPPPGTADHVYLSTHPECAVWVALGGLVLLALLLGCLAVEGSELYFSGLV
eukprot:TRINITY_DN2140_c1_g1_i1.p1 TRINITY_DN2140_c1_g1~~TRINITY_DN2140_c1_g1_i1.p1  ORF type:complete len:240 (+),score=32.87 TRINITY_DN2140_c1_g1_i1:156-875(+)